VIEGRVELLGDRLLDRAPNGFAVAESERSWVTAPDITVSELRALSVGSGAPLPAAVAIGDLEGGRLLIDIETAGVLTVDGETRSVEAFIRRVLAELATSTWADHVDVLVVGSTEVDVVGTHRVRQFSELAEAMSELKASAHAFAEALDSARMGRTIDARLSKHHDDGWIPTILVCAEPVESDVVAELYEITAEGGRGTGAIVASTARAEWHAHVGEAELVLEPLGFHVAPAVLDLATARALDELFTEMAVGDPPAVLVAEPRAAPTAVSTTGELYLERPFEVEMRVLGPVDIIGGAKRMDRRRCIELAVYLALHGKGSTDERLKTALWPEGAPTTATFNTTVSMTRSALGRARDGTLHLPHFVASGGAYKLGNAVTTDLTRLEARVEYARTCARSVAIETLRSALELVRGKPFESGRGYEWAFSEGLVANIEMTIADASHQLAQLYLDAGDSRGATWAAMQGLMAAPGDEILYRDRMLACDLAGNPAGVETVMDELCEVIEALEPYDQLHPETLELYERISHRKRTLRAR
jgi:hypothetical protein